MQTTVETEIKDFILTTLVKDMNTLPDTTGIVDTSPVGTGGIDLDSLGLIELTLRLEQRFGVEIPDTDIEPLGAMTLSELVADVVRRGATV